MNERSSLYRREHHKEAMVWQDRGRQDGQTEDEDEDRQTDAELKHMVRETRVHKHTRVHAEQICESERTVHLLKPVSGLAELYFFLLICARVPNYFYLVSGQL